MKGNDLSNKMSPRHVIVFEGGLASLPLDRVTDYEKSYKRKRYWEAVKYWVWNSRMLGLHLILPRLSLIFLTSRAFMIQIQRTYLHSDHEEYT